MLDKNLPPDHHLPITKQTLTPFSVPSIREMKFMICFYYYFT